MWYLVSSRSATPCHEWDQCPSLDEVIAGMSGWGYGSSFNFVRAMDWELPDWAERGYCLQPGTGSYTVALVVLRKQNV